MLASETGGVDSVSHPPEGEWPPAGRAWWALFVFGVTLTISYVDRGVVNLLVEPIKADLHLSDTQISLVMGFAFITFYLILGLPLARVIDGGPRRAILGTCVTIWSVATGLCGLAQSFFQLALFRVGVGAGEAGVAPAISSMVSDLFPPHKLPRAMSMLAFAFIGGNALALLLGGFVLGSLSTSGPLTILGMGPLKPWQLTFLAVGLPGLFAALLYLTVPDPVRRGGHATAGKDTPTLVEVLRYIRKNASVFGPMFIGLALHSVAFFGTLAWSPAFFSRTHGWSPAHYGSVAGIVGLVASPIGLMIGFRITESFIRKGYDDASLRLVVWATWLALPFHIAMPLMPNPYLAVGMIAISGAIGVSAIGSQNAAMMMVTPNRMRGQMTALFLAMYNVIGFGAGPTVVAVLTDFVFGREALLRWALLCTALVLPAGSAILLTLGLKPYGEEVARIRTTA
ncbi:MFS transporter [Sphingobium sp. Leaf26]|uniref:MFS transporter n=1 Tax=Sphingobium sp. Leaf26 TaxID=1735693 RepID=UPI0009E9F208|nr:MFS transporter [Sphingobium sp. Leaf26]